MCASLSDCINNQGNCSNSIVNDVFISHVFCCSEFRGGSSCVVALLATFALIRTTAELHGPPVRCRGGYQHGPAHPAQLRGVPAQAVLMVGPGLLLCHLPTLRHLLEHLRLRAAGSPDSTSALMIRPRLFPSSSCGWPHKRQKLDFLMASFLFLLQLHPLLTSSGQKVQTQRLEILAVMFFQTVS